MTWLRAALAIVLCAAMLLAGSGCAGPARRPLTTGPLPPTAVQRAQLGMVAVAAGPRSHGRDRDFWTPAQPDFEPRTGTICSRRPSDRAAALGFGVGVFHGAVRAFPYHREVLGRGRHGRIPEKRHATEMGDDPASATPSVLQISRRQSRLAAIRSPCPRALRGRRERRAGAPRR